MRNIEFHPMSRALRPSDEVHSVVLSANTAESISVPSGATHVLLAATADIYVKYFESDEDDDIVTNGAFAADSDWTKGAGWTIAAGVATATGGISTALSQTPVTDLIEGQAYLVTFTATRSAGGVTVSLGGTDGTERTTSDTFSEVIIAGATTDIAFTGNGFTGTIDDVSVVPVAAVPADNSTGQAAELISANADQEGRMRIIAGLATLSVVSAGTPVVTASFFKT